MPFGERNFWERERKSERSRAILNYTRREKSDFFCICLFIDCTYTRVSKDAGVTGRPPGDSRSYRKWTLPTSSIYRPRHKFPLSVWHLWALDFNSKKLEFDGTTKRRTPSYPTSTRYSSSLWIFAKAITSSTYARIYIWMHPLYPIHARRACMCAGLLSSELNMNRLFKQ